MSTRNLKCVWNGYARASTALSLLFAGAVFGHGGVVMEEDLCVINIGFYRAHFTVYQPQTSANEEFCEDLPDAGETIFVLDYLHDSMKRVPVDFRIIKENKTVAGSIVPEPSSVALIAFGTFGALAGFRNRRRA